MTADFGAWIDARLVALDDGPPSMSDWPEPEPLPIDHELMERVRRELDEEIAAATRRAVEEAFA